jgi:hypothetical protein
MITMKGSTAPLALTSLAAILVAGPSPDVCAGPRKASGFFAEAGLGAHLLVKPSSTLSPGPALSLRLGRDLFSWLSLGVAVSMSSHASALPPPPDGEYLQLYQGAGHARIGGLIGSVSIFVEGGGGLARVSTNLLERGKLTTPGQRNSITFFCGAGAELQLDNRHYAVGLAANGWIMPQFDAALLAAGRLYLRYVY